MIKLLDVSKNVISKFTAEKIYNETLEWAKNYDEELKRLLENHQEYSLKVLNIERGNAAFRYACKLQNSSGGWYGSYLSIENMEENIFKAR